jgi:hypothetical protein
VIAITLTSNGTHADRAVFASDSLLDRAHPPVHPEAPNVTGITEGSNDQPAAARFLNQGVAAHTNQRAGNSTHGPKSRTGKADGGALADHANRVRCTWITGLCIAEK